MAVVARSSIRNMTKSDADNTFYELRDEDGDLVSFSISDILKRVESLRAAMFEPARQAAKIVVIGGGKCG
jgi:hypothetical protein